MADRHSSERNKPIGIFDSGVGGLTVFRAVQRRLPDENVIYLGDTARIPYGTKSLETVRRYSIEDADFLLSQGIKLLVVACNTASALALDTLRDHLPIPVVGVIAPGARRAAALSARQRIGVIATEATVASRAYTEAIRAVMPELRVIEKACPLFVPLAEEGWIGHPVTEMVAAEYLAPLRNAGIDTLVLGCTHYPILRPPIQTVMGDAVTLVDSGESAAEEVEAVLAACNLLNPGTTHRMTRFCVTDAGHRFRRIAEIFLGEPMPHPEIVDLWGKPVTDGRH